MENLSVTAFKLGRFVILLFLLIGLGACTSRTQIEPSVLPTPTFSTFFSLDSEPTRTVIETDAPGNTPEVENNPESSPTSVNDLRIIEVEIDTQRNIHPISPLIYGVSVAPTDYVGELGATLNSWGGNPATRYNWQLGNAWNAGSDWFYRNGNYGFETGSVSDAFISGTLQSGAQVRLAVPTLGWVAKDSDVNTCSFPLPDGGCGDGGGANCENPIEIADPEKANVPIDSEFVQDWLRHLTRERGFPIRFIAMDNEPELWGYTHYDVHPSCTTYEEILQKFLIHSEAALSVVPDAEVTGPVTCCWHYYWNSAAGDGDKANHGYVDFLPWFLEQVRIHDEETGNRSLHVLDIHYYPEGLYNSDSDAETAAWRLRSTRSLWDPNYVDESWIDEAVYLIPTMKTLIDDFYPGTRLGISEWNWGAEESLNGALAIADVLGIYGREDVYMAAYWTYPPEGSPGYFAFRMYTNFDGQGRRFGDTSVWASTGESEDVSSYAAIDNLTGNLQVMFVNKDPAEPANVNLSISGFSPNSDVELFRYGPENLMEISTTTVRLDLVQDFIYLPPYSISLFIFSGSS